MSDNSQFAKEFMGEASKRGGVKMMSDVVGMPDHEDEELLRQLISIYEQKTKGLLGYTLREARRQFEVGKFGSTFNQDATVNKKSNMHYDFEFPESFITVVEKHYPTMFRDKAHYAWFKRKLPGLMIRPK